MSDFSRKIDDSIESNRNNYITQSPESWSKGDLGGFDFAGSLLEFDLVKDQIAGYTKTVVGGERSRSLVPTKNLLEIVTRLQETSEARQYLEIGPGLEFGPDRDFRELLQRALLGGLLRGEELFAVRELIRQPALTVQN